VGTFPPDGRDADEGQHHDDGESQGYPEQGRVLLGECGHRGDEEKPDEAHCDDKLHSEDRVHLPDEVEPDGLVGEAATHSPISTFLPSLEGRRSIGCHDQSKRAFSDQKRLSKALLICGAMISAPSAVVQECFVTFFPLLILSIRTLYTGNKEVIYAKSESDKLMPGPPRNNIIAQEPRK